MATDQELDAFAQQMADLTSHHIEGIAYAGNTPFSMPIITHVEGNLWQGGSPADAGGRLPGFFRFVLNLYPWAEYHWDPGDNVEYEMWRHRLYDASEVPDVDLLERMAAWVNARRALGPTLVHCQAGLNRSGLVTGLALVRSGMTPDAAIALLRDRRSPAVLCNEVFEKWLRGQVVPGKLADSAAPEMGNVGISRPLEATDG